jgi:hypothetical protein
MTLLFSTFGEGPGGSMGWVVGLPNNSYKPITNTAWVRARLCKLQKRCTRLATANDKDCQLLAHSRWFSPGTPVSSTTKTGRHDIAESLLKVTLNTINQIKSINIWWDLGLLIPFKLLYIVYCAFDIIQLMIFDEVDIRN